MEQYSPFPLIRIIVFLLFINKISVAQVPKDFGEGIVTVSMYYIPLADSAKLASMDTAHSIFNRYTYYVKGCKILRKDIENIPDNRISMKEEHDSIIVRSNLKTTLLHPTYLIDWNTRQTYTFYQRHGKLHVSEDSLKMQKTELFYRMYLPDSMRKPKVLDASKVLVPAIVNKICYAGTGTLHTGKTYPLVSFAYTTDSCPVRSPINGYFPGFSHNILSMTTHSLQPDNTIQGFVIFTVTDLRSCSLNDSLFTIPAGAVIKRNVPWQEMYDLTNQ